MCSLVHAASSCPGPITVDDINADSRVKILISSKDKKTVLKFQFIIFYSSKKRVFFSKYIYKGIMIGTNASRSTPGIISYALATKVSIEIFFAVFIYPAQRKERNGKLRFYIYFFVKIK